jgi:hypothetical protein
MKKFALMSLALTVATAGFVGFYLQQVKAETPTTMAYADYPGYYVNDEVNEELTDGYDSILEIRVDFAAELDEFASKIEALEGQYDEAMDAGDTDRMEQIRAEVEATFEDFRDDVIYFNAAFHAWMWGWNSHILK